MSLDRHDMFHLGLEHLNAGARTSAGVFHTSSALESGCSINLSLKRGGYGARWLDEPRRTGCTGEVHILVSFPGCL